MTAMSKDPFGSALVMFLTTLIVYQLYVGRVNEVVLIATPLAWIAWVAWYFKDVRGVRA